MNKKAGSPRGAAKKRGGVPKKAPAKTTKKKTRTRKITRATALAWIPNFLRSLRELPNVSYAARRSGITRAAAYKARKENAELAAAWEESLREGVELLEEVTWKQATIGSRKPIWMKDPDGNPVKVDEVLEFNTTAAIFMLKAHAPDKYREKVDIGNSDGEPLRISMDPIAEASLRRVYGDTAITRQQ